MAVSAPLLPYFPASNVPMYNNYETKEFINHTARPQTTEISDSTNCNIGDGDQYQPRPVYINSLGARMKTRRGGRNRTIYTKRQRELLENMFATTQFPNIIEREELADQIGVQQERIQTWFKNRRAKEKTQKRKRHSEENTSATSVSKKSRSNEENRFRSHMSSMQKLAILGRAGLAVSCQNPHTETSPRQSVEDTDKPKAIYLPETSRPSPYCMYYSSETSNDDSKKTVGTTSPACPFDEYADTFSDISTASVPPTPDLQSITNHSYFDDRRSYTCSSFAWNTIDDHGSIAIPSCCPFTTPIPEDYWQDFYRDSVNPCEQYHPFAIPSFQSTFEPILGTSPFSVQDTRTPDQYINNYQASFLFATPYNHSIHP